MENGIFEWNNLKKRFQKRTVLDVEHIELQRGKRYVIVGENGAGKSTLLNILAGVLKSECKDNTQTKKYHIAYMPQKPYIFHMSVLENMKKAAKHKTIDELEHILEQLDISNLKDNQATKLSGGEKQRLAFGRVISQSCELLLLDEPSSAMDVKGAVLFEQVLQNYLKRCGCTLIMTTHDIAQAKRIADEIIFMKNGKIIMQGNYKKLFYDTEDTFIREYANYFIGE